MLKLKTVFLQKKKKGHGIRNAPSQGLVYKDVEIFRR